MAIEKAGNIDYAARRIRHGKTAKDRRSGAFQRNAANHAARAGYVQWCAETVSKQATTAQAVAKYPSHLNMGNGNGAKRRPERRPARAAR